MMTANSGCARADVSYGFVGSGAMGLFLLCPPQVSRLTVPWRRGRATVSVAEAALRRKHAGREELRGVRDERWQGGERRWTHHLPGCSAPAYSVHSSFTRCITRRTRSPEDTRQVGVPLAALHALTACAALRAALCGSFVKSRAGG